MRITNCLALVFMLVITASGCESDSPTAPDPGDDNGSGSEMTGGGGGGGGGGGDDGGGGGTGPQLSSTTATIDGQPYAATEILAPSPDFIAESSGGLAPPTLVVSTGERSTGWAVAVGAPAEVGTHTIPTPFVSATLTKLPPYGAGELPEEILDVKDIEQWNAVGPFGSGSVTVTTLTETTATGTFSFMLVPNTASSAMGNKMLSGSFSLTFTDGIEIQF